MPSFLSWAAMEPVVLVPLYYGVAHRLYPTRECQRSADKLLLSRIE